uniref:Uncharacterized protein n=1 Tax=Caenorhabditis japonica TaxID=281687 RepID=A0A8R1DIU7_CAEJA
MYSTRAIDWRAPVVMWISALAVIIDVFCRPGINTLLMFIVFCKTPPKKDSKGKDIDSLHNILLLHQATYDKLNKKTDQSILRSFAEFFAYFAFFSGFVNNPIRNYPISIFFRNAQQKIIKTRRSRTSALMKNTSQVPEDQV